MPSKKRKYNARFPAGRIKKIMQTDEEVGKVAQAVPIIISRTLELFVESLLGKAMQVTMARNARTLSPSHVKQCILAEQRFDFLRDLVKNIPDVSAAEEKEMMSAESSPNTTRFPELAPPRKITREDSNSSSGSDVKVVQVLPPAPIAPAPASAPAPLTNTNNVRISDLETRVKIETITSTTVSSEGVIDLSKKSEEKRPNFYQETLPDEVQHRGVIRVNPTYATPQPSTSNYTSLTPVEPVCKVDIPLPLPKSEPKFFIDLSQNHIRSTTIPPLVPLTPSTPTLNSPLTSMSGYSTPITPVINIDFTKGMAPEIKVLDSSVANIIAPKETKKLQRQNSRPPKESKKVEIMAPAPMNIDILNSGNLQIDEDYDT